MYLSLMTLPMFFRCFFTFYMSKDVEGFHDNYEEMLDYVEQADIKYIDITSRELDFLGADYIKSQLDKRGIAVSSVLSQRDYALLSSDIDKMKEVINSELEAVKQLDCKIMMLIPEAPADTATVNENEIKQSLIKTFKYATDLALQNKVTTVIEDTPALSLNLCTSKQLEEMLDAVEGLKMVYDSGNMLLVNEDPATYYKKFKGRISYIHLKDMRLATSADRRPDVSVSGVKMTGAYSGTGMVDFNKLIKAILESGYDGGMTVEFAYKDGITFPDSLIEAKNYFEDIIERNRKN